MNRNSFHLVGAEISVYFLTKHLSQAASSSASRSTRPNPLLPLLLLLCFSPFFSLVLPSAFFSASGSSILGTVHSDQEESFCFSLSQSPYSCHLENKKATLTFLFENPNSVKPQELPVQQSKNTEEKNPGLWNSFLQQTQCSRQCYHVFLQP